MREQTDSLANRLVRPSRTVNVSWQLSGMAKTWSVSKSTAMTRCWVTTPITLTSRPPPLLLSDSYTNKSTNFTTFSQIQTWTNDASVVGKGKGKDVILWKNVGWTPNFLSQAFSHTMAVPLNSVAHANAMPRSLKMQDRKQGRSWHRCKLL